MLALFLYILAKEIRKIDLFWKQPKWDTEAGDEFEDPQNEFLVLSSVHKMRYDDKEAKYYPE